MKVILTVDDSMSLRRMVKTVLESAGYSVIEAADGADALTKLDGREFDLIISDINMPNMNGIDLARQIRRLVDYQFVPIVLLTSESGADKKQKAKEAGATGWMVKPFTPDQLVAVVNKIVR